MYDALGFFTEVVEPNVKDLSDDPASLRAAVNTISSLDAFFGVLFVERKSNIQNPIETEFREQHANQCEAYRVIRDAAFSLKHGELEHGERRVWVAQDTVKNEMRWDDTGVWNDEAMWVDEMIFVNYLDKSKKVSKDPSTHDRIPAHRLAEEVCRYERSLLDGTSYCAKSLKDLKNVLV